MWGCSKLHEYIYGLYINIILETDHKPIVAVSNKSLNYMSPIIQRLMLRLQKYIFSVEWTPGKYLCIADTLSRGTFKQRCVTYNSELNFIIDAQVNSN